MHDVHLREPRIVPTRLIDSGLGNGKQTVRAFEDAALRQRKGRPDLEAAEQNAVTSAAWPRDPRMYPRKPTVLVEDQARTSRHGREQRAPKPRATAQRRTLWRRGHHAKPPSALKNVAHALRDTANAAVARPEPRRHEQHVESACPPHDFRRRAIGDTIRYSPISHLRSPRHRGRFPNTGQILAKLTGLFMPRGICQADVDARCTTSSRSQRALTLARAQLEVLDIDEHWVPERL